MNKWITLFDLDCNDHETAIERINNLFKLGLLRDFKEKYEFRLLCPKGETILKVQEKVAANE